MLFECVWPLLFIPSASLLRPLPYACSCELSMYSDVLCMDDVESEPLGGFLVNACRTYEAFGVKYSLMLSHCSSVVIAGNLTDGQHCTGGKSQSVFYQPQLGGTSDQLTAFSGCLVRGALPGSHRISCASPLILPDPPVLSALTTFQFYILVTVAVLACMLCWLFTAFRLSDILHGTNTHDLQPSPAVSNTTLNKTTEQSNSKKHNAPTSPPTHSQPQQPPKQPKGYTIARQYVAGNRRVVPTRTQQQRPATNQAGATLV
eukprot:TRINITY_DN96856_c0_g1_i1.p1 TRINITY_DN96856_c0_g1~~TRINITY_DN96856_c0_g1_i1.p1  ORF type:complete len:260 (-),score=18.75 TRINITY_DN96856_c0_g1_i1:9-788(-)